MGGDKGSQDIEGFKNSQTAGSIYSVLSDICFLAQGGLVWEGLNSQPPPA